MERRMGLVLEVEVLCFGRSRLRGLCVSDCGVWHIENAR